MCPVSKTDMEGKSGSVLSLFKSNATDNNTVKIIVSESKSINDLGGWN